MYISLTQYLVLLHLTFVQLYNSPKPATPQHHLRSISNQLNWNTIESFGRHATQSNWCHWTWIRSWSRSYLLHLVWRSIRCELRSPFAIASDVVFVNYQNKFIPKHNVYNTHRWDMNGVCVCLSVHYRFYYICRFFSLDLYVTCPSLIFDCCNRASCFKARMYACNADVVSPNPLHQHNHNITMTSCECYSLVSATRESSVAMISRGNTDLLNSRTWEIRYRNDPSISSTSGMCMAHCRIFEKERSARAV